LVMPPLPAYAWSWDALWLRPDQRALRALADGEARQAAGQLADPRWRAAAHYRAGQYQLAYQALATQGGVEAHYNRGNCLARLGRYAEAAGEYEAVLSIDPGHADARHNRDLLARLLARPEQPARERPADGTPAGAGDGGAGSDEDAPRAEIGAGAARSGQPPWDAGPGDDGAGPEDGASRDIGAGAPARPPEERSRPLVPAPSAPAGRGGQDQGRLAGDGSRSNGERAVADPRTPAAGGGGEEAGVRGVPGGWTETEQAAGTPSPADYLLRQVPDDPAGLLRARLLMQHLRRHGRLR